MYTCIVLDVALCFSAATLRHGLLRSMSGRTGGPLRSIACSKGSPDRARVSGRTGGPKPAASPLGPPVALLLLCAAYVGVGSSVDCMRLPETTPAPSPDNCCVIQYMQVSGLPR